MKFKAFTLAEVLITLAVIGIVAALTIPALVKNYQERTWSTASQVFERKLEEALKSMNAQETLAGYSTTKDFVNELSKHIKITKICENNELTSCFSEKVYWGVDKEEVEISKIKNAKNFGQDGWGTENIGIQFSNGINGIIAYNPACAQDPYNNQYTGINCIALLYDVDGYKTPNTQSKDLRGINIISLGSNCLFEIDGVCFTAPIRNIGMSFADCEQQKTELGIKECYCDPDYWAGAVQFCGGIDKMMSVEQLGKLASILYNTDEPITQNTYNLTLDRDKAISYYGLPNNSNGWYIWSNKEADEDQVYYFYFMNHGVGVGNDTSLKRSNSGGYAFCIGY